MQTLQENMMLSDKARTIRVSAISQSCTGKKETNLLKTKEMIIKAKEDGAQLIVLQELHATEYFCQKQDTEHFDLAEDLNGPTVEFFSKLALEQKLVIVCSIFEKRTSGVYHNTAVVLDIDGEIAGIYRKMHIPQDPGFEEKFYFTPGDLGFEPISCSLGKLAVMICWDQWYPEAARIMALKGAEILIYPTAIGWSPEDSDKEQKTQLEAWVNIQKSHSIANGLPLVSCNRVGVEGNIKFWGNSFITGAMGEELARANSTDEEIITATIDLSSTKKRRDIWPFFRDRRVDEYEEILCKYID